MASRLVRVNSVTVNNVLDGHVKLDLDGGPGVFRTAESAFSYAAFCSFRYSMRASCGGRYPFAV
jgi:hypothetical protein